MEVDQDASTMSGQLNHNHNIHNSGQDQQTLRRNHHTRNNLRSTKKTTNKPSRQEQHQDKSNINAKQPTEQEIMEHNLTHMPYDHRVPSACRDVADQMHIHNEAAADPSYKSILHF